MNFARLGRRCKTGWGVFATGEGETEGGGASTGGSASGEGVRSGEAFGVAPGGVAKGGVPGGNMGFSVAGTFSGDSDFRHRALAEEVGEGNGESEGVGGVKGVGVADWERFVLDVFFVGSLADDFDAFLEFEFDLDFEGVADCAAATGGAAGEPLSERGTAAESGNRVAHAEHETSRPAIASGAVSSLLQPGHFTRMGIVKTGLF